MMVPHLHLIAAILVIAGAINWGLVGLLNFNLVETLGELLGAKEIISRVIYVLVGIAGVIQLITILKPGLF